MDYGKAFAYALEDSEWPTKLGVGTLVNIVPILNFATTGYMVQITRNVMNQGPDVLPEWDDFGQKFVDGLVIVLASFIYSLPFFLLWCVASASLLLPVLGGKNEEITRALAGLSFAALCVIGCLSLLYLLALAFVFPAITIFYAREGSFGACFKVGEIVRFISDNLGIYLGAVVVLLAGGVMLLMLMGVVQLFLSIIPICGNVIGLFITWALVLYLQVVAAHLFGQVGREAVLVTP